MSSEERSVDAVRNGIRAGGGGLCHRASVPLIHSGSKVAFQVVAVVILRLLTVSPHLEESH